MEKYFLEPSAKIEMMTSVTLGDVKLGDSVHITTTSGSQYLIERSPDFENKLLVYNKPANHKDENWEEGWVLAFDEEADKIIAEEGKPLRLPVYRLMPKEQEGRVIRSSLVLKIDMRKGV